MRENSSDSTLPRPTRFSLILQFAPHATTTHTMRAVDYVTHGFGIQPQVMPVPTYVMPNPNLVGGGGPIPAGIGNPRYTTSGQGGFIGNLQYGLSPSGSFSTLGNRGRTVQDLGTQFGETARRWATIGLNPNFIDIARGPSGRAYLTQATNFLQAYISALPRNGYNVNAAYNTAASIVGTSSPLTPSRTLIANVTPARGETYYNGLFDFYRLVLSAL